MFQPLQDALSTFFGYIPQLIGATVILVIGYVIARVLRAVVGRVLQGIGFDRRGREGQWRSLEPGRQRPAVSGLRFVERPPDKRKVGRVERRGDRASS